MIPAKEYTKEKLFILIIIGIFIMFVGTLVGIHEAHADPVPYYYDVFDEKLNSGSCEFEYVEEEIFREWECDDDCSLDEDEREYERETWDVNWNFQDTGSGWPPTMPIDSDASGQVWPMVPGYYTGSGSAEHVREGLHDSCRSTVDLTCSGNTCTRVYERQGDGCRLECKTTTETVCDPDEGDNTCTRTVEQDGECVEGSEPVVIAEFDNISRNELVTEYYDYDFYDGYDEWASGILRECVENIGQLIWSHKDDDDTVDTTIERTWSHTTITGGANPTELYCTGEDPEDVSYTRRRGGGDIDFKTVGIRDGEECTPDEPCESDYGWMLSEWGYQEIQKGEYEFDRGICAQRRLLDLSCDLEILSVDGEGEGDATVRISGEDREATSFETIESVEARWEWSGDDVGNEYITARDPDAPRWCVMDPHASFDRLCYPAPPSQGPEYVGESVEQSYRRDAAPGSPSINLVLDDIDTEYGAWYEIDPPFGTLDDFYEEGTVLCPAFWIEGDEESELFLFWGHVPESRCPNCEVWNDNGNGNGNGNGDNGNGCDPDDQPDPSLCDSFTDSDECPIVGATMTVECVDDSWRYSCEGGVKEDPSCPDGPQCGSAHENNYVGLPPEDDRCEVGSVNTFISWGPRYTWNCVEGGDSTQCEAFRVQCGDVESFENEEDVGLDDLCTNADSYEDLREESGVWNWYCYGQDSPDRKRSCQADTEEGNGSIDAQCGDAHENGPYRDSSAVRYDGLCEVTDGEDEDVNIGVDGNDWTWECEGVNGGEDAECRAPRIIDGQCGGSDGEVYDSSTEPEDLCNQGSRTSPFWNDTQWTWECEGINGGDTAECSTDEDDASGSTQPHGFIWEEF